MSRVGALMSPLEALMSPLGALMSRLGALMSRVGAVTTGCRSAFAGQHGRSRTRGVLGLRREEPVRMQTQFVGQNASQHAEDSRGQFPPHVHTLGDGR